MFGGVGSADVWGVGRADGWWEGHGGTREEDRFVPGWFCVPTLQTLPQAQVAPDPRRGPVRWFCSALDVWLEIGSTEERFEPCSKGERLNARPFRPTILSLKVFFGTFGLVHGPSESLSRGKLPAEVGQDPSSTIP